MDNQPVNEVPVPSTENGARAVNLSAEREDTKPVEAKQDTSKGTGSLAVRKSSPSKSKGSGGLVVHQPSGLPNNRPIISSGVQIVGTFIDGGIRPIGASDSHLVESDYHYGNRPIAANYPEVTSLVHLEEAPLFYGRPVAANYPDVAHRVNLENAEIFYKRPIASNDIDDPITLMGYLD